MKLRTAVIGVGSMGKNHARILAGLPESELVGVTDTNLDLARQVAELYSVRAYSHYQDLLEKEKPDVVSICVPTALHEKVALDTLNANAHLLVEKPITATIQEGKNVIQKARDSGKKLMIGHIVRFNPAIQALKHKLEQGELGRIFQIICRRTGPFPARIRDVGVVVDLAPHDIDVMRFLTGMDPIRVFAETEQRIHTEHEDLVLGILRFPEGISGALEINWLTPTKVREVRVLGERGMFLVNDLTQDLFFYENSEVSGVDWTTLSNLKGVSEGPMTRYGLERYEPLRAEIESFLRSIIEDTPVPVTGEDGLAALKLALALVESGKTHQVIEFNV